MTSKMKADKPSELRELDIWIAVHLMGYQWCIFGALGEPVFVSELFPRFTREHKTQYGWRKASKPERGSEVKTDLVPHYTTKSASAMQVLDKLRGKHTLLMATTQSGNPIIGVTALREYEGRKAYPAPEFARDAETLPLAICRLAKQLFSQ